MWGSPKMLQAFTGSFFAEGVGGGSGITSSCTDFVYTCFVWQLVALATYLPVIPSVNLSNIISIFKNDISSSTFAKAI